MFSFNYKKCVDIWNIEWDEICNRLEKNEENLPKFEDLIKDDVFSHVIAQIMEYSKLFTVYPQDISKLFRGVCENDPSKICVERFIPQKEYINPEKQFPALSKSEWTEVTEKAIDSLRDYMEDYYLPDSFEEVIGMAMDDVTRERGKER